MTQSTYRFEGFAIKDDRTRNIKSCDPDSVVLLSKTIEDALSQIETKLTSPKLVAVHQCNLFWNV